MPVELSPSRRLKRVGPTTPENPGIPTAFLHGDPTALATDYHGVDLASVDPRELGSLLTPKVGGEDTRKSILQVNTGGERAGNNKITVYNHFPYEMGSDNHYAPTTWEPYARRLQAYDSHVKALFVAHPDTYMTVTTPNGLAVAMETEGRIGVIKSVEGMPQRRGRTSLNDAVQSLAALDTRIVDLMWNRPTEFGSWHKESEDNGLTQAGIDLLTACADSGIPIFDVSHASPKTAQGMIELSNRIGADSLVIASHTGAQTGDAKHITRNITDDVARGIFDQGGLIGIGLTSGMLGGTTIDHVIQAIVHFASLRDNALSHIALGPDFNGMENGKQIKGAANVVEVQNLAKAFRDAGFSENEIEGIFWRNAYDVLHGILPESA